MNPRLFQWVTVTLALALTLAVQSQSLVKAEENHDLDQQRAELEDSLESSAPQTGPSSSPTLIDWKTYTSAFKKSYSSLGQQLIRHRLFMAKKIQVFVTAVKFRFNQLSYYMVINQYSDLTPEEERAKLSGDAGGEDDDDDPDLIDDQQVERELLVELAAAAEEQKAAAEAASMSASRPPDKRRPAARRSLPVKSQQNPKRRVIRSIDQPEPEANPEHGVACQDISLADLVRIPGLESGSNEYGDQGPLKIKWVVPSNNPDYQPYETVSFGEYPQDVPSQAKDVPADQVEYIEQSTSSWLSLPIPKVVSVLSDSAKSTYTWLKSKSFNMRQQQQQQQQNTEEENDDNPQKSDEIKKSETPSSSAARSEKKGDVVIKDWRQSGCLAPPIDQGDCESCYAVSSMAFLEWAFCMNQNRVLTPLSAQYFISCGPQFREEADPKLKIEFHGCNKGRSRQAMYFVKDYGAELEANMPYLGMDTPCPIEPGTPLRHKGYIRPNVRQPVRMAATTRQLELALKVGPVIVNFREPANFMAYGGGMVTQCYQRGGHAMLVVGHGIENDKPYLIIKNSFGTNWGIRGYFKFDREYTTECVKDFVLPRVSFPSKKSQARRVKAYLAAELGLTTNKRMPESNLKQRDDILYVGAGGLFSQA